MGVEERELLMPVHDIAGVVDIENHRRGLPFIGGHPLIDERPREPDRILKRRRILKRPLSARMVGDVALCTGGFTFTPASATSGEEGSWTKVVGKVGGE